MQIVITLLVSALHLLQLVQGSPNLPQPIRDNAITIANSAIVYAQQQINLSQTTMPQTQPQVGSTFGTSTTPGISSPPVLGSTSPSPSTPQDCQEDLVITDYSPNPSNPVAGLGSSNGSNPNEKYDFVIPSIHATAKCSSEWYTEITSNIPDFEQPSRKMGFSKIDSGYLLTGKVAGIYPMYQAGTYTITMTVSNKDKSIVKTASTTVTSRGTYTE